MILPADCPRFAKPGLSCIPMVYNLVQPSPILQGSAATIPLLDCDLPFSLRFSHHPYKIRPHFKYTIIPIYFGKFYTPFAEFSKVHSAFSKLCSSMENTHVSKNNSTSRRILSRRVETTYGCYDRVKDEVEVTKYS
jgi:hypothetical protein